MGQLSHITGIEVDYNNLNNDRFSSNTIEAIKYQNATKLNNIQNEFIKL